MRSSTRQPAHPGSPSTTAAAWGSVFRNTPAWLSLPTALRVPSVGWNASSPAIPAWAFSATPMPAIPAPSNSLPSTRLIFRWSRSDGISIRPPLFLSYRHLDNEKALVQRAGEHRPLACSSRQLAANMLAHLRRKLLSAFGQRPNAAGWQPALPRPHRVLLLASLLIT